VAGQPPYRLELSDGNLEASAEVMSWDGRILRPPIRPGECQFTLTAQDAARCPTNAAGLGSQVRPAGPQQAWPCVPCHRRSGKSLSAQRRAVELGFLSKGDRDERSHSHSRSRSCRACCEVAGHPKVSVDSLTQPAVADLARQRGREGHFDLDARLPRYLPQGHSRKQTAAADSAGTVEAELAPGAGRG